MGRIAAVTRHLASQLRSLEDLGWVSPAHAQDLVVITDPGRPAQTGGNLAGAAPATTPASRRLTGRRPASFLSLCGAMNRHVRQLRYQAPLLAVQAESTPFQRGPWRTWK